MGFWIFMLCMNLLIPLTMLGFGALFERKAPSAINGVIGYRTRRSMKTQETWNFAQKYMGKIWKKWGIILSIPAVIVTIVLFGKSEDVIGGVSVVLVNVQIVVMLASIYPVEKALKEKFHEDGSPKEGV